MYLGVAGLLDLLELKREQGEEDAEDVPARPGLARAQPRMEEEEVKSIMVDFQRQVAAEQKRQLPATAALDRLKAFLSRVEDGTVRLAYRDAARVRSWFDANRLRSCGPRHFIGTGQKKRRTYRTESRRTRPNGTAPPTM